LNPGCHSFINRAAYHAGYGTPLAATGPRGGALGGLTTEAAIAFSFRPVRRGSSTVVAGETEATAMGRTVHADLAAARRADGTFDVVNAPITGPDGLPIKVPVRVDLGTGEPIVARGVQTVRPDAVRFLESTIIDDKPIGRAISSDRQEIIRFIEAYKQSRGEMPTRIAIQRYDPLTGQPVVTELYQPWEFMPWIK
jgi:hypothetical protein